MGNCTGILKVTNIGLCFIVRMLFLFLFYMGGYNGRYKCGKLGFVA